MQNAIGHSNLLARNNVNQDELDGDKQFSSLVLDYSNRVEEIIAWLFKKEEELQQRPSEASLKNASFNLILDEYSRHERFMTEFCEYCHTIMDCKLRGQEMRDNNASLNDEDRDEIGIQLDAMMVCHEKLKILTTDRLRNLQSIIEDCQRSNIARLEEWLSSMESRMASSNSIGPDYNAIQQQIRKIDELRNELTQKQDFLNFISKVIIFDEIDTESLQIRSRSCQSLDDQLETMNRRWTNICQLVDSRSEKLRKAESIWKILQREGPQLGAWLKKVECSLNEVSEAARSITDPEAEKPFVYKLLARFKKIGDEKEKKKIFYSSLENRVRIEIGKFDDPCSMLVIELEKRLEEIEDNWNTILRQQRMLDFNLQNLLNPKSSGPMASIIPIPDPITTVSNNNIRFDTMIQNNGAIDTAEELKKSLDNPMNNSSSSGNDDQGSSFPLNGSLSDPKTLDNSLSFESRSLVYDNNHGFNDNDSQDGLSSATNLTSSHPIMFAGINEQDTSYSSSRPPLISDSQEGDLRLSGKFPEIEDDFPYDNHSHQNETHSCRVEEWRHSLESFSTWLKQVETSLGVDGTVDSWSRLNIQDQLALLNDIGIRIVSTCQDEFDCLLLQGQQIIEDLMPEIGENEYEANLKEILTDIEIRYSAVQRCLRDRKRDLADREKWRRLSRKLKDSCEYLINRLGEVIEETDIGVDLITLAQQQDQLMHLKEDLNDNNLILSSIQEARLFLQLYDNLKQQYGQQQQLKFSKSNSGTQQSSDIADIWMSFRDFKEEIEDQLDRLTLHHSELSQVIEDRLERLDEIHKEMHALQHRIQELATNLQVAEILKSKWMPLEDLSIEQLSEQLEDLKLYRERLGETESIHKNMNSIVEWMSQTEVPLSQPNLKRIDEMNLIWNSMQMTVEDRQKQIEQAFDEQSGSEQKFLFQTVSDWPKWERKVATSKVPYFIDHDSNKTLWDHPKFTALLDRMSELKQYVFSVYRTAMKLRIIQKSLGIDLLMLEHLKDIFNSHGLGLPQVSNTNTIESQSTQAINDSPVDVEQIIQLLKSIYGRIQAEEAPSLDVPLAIDLTLNWLLNLYDSTRTGYVSSLSLKVGLALMSCATREEKYIYMYELIASPLTGATDARKLGILFESCMRIPMYLGESESFGGSELIETSIRNCFSMAKFNPQHPNCIDLTDYLAWLKTEPQFIVWLPVLHRILISETTVHPTKCKLCGANPIIGLRYRCLKCFKFNICQKCFLTGRHIYEHFNPSKHLMQEYCCKMSSGELVRDYTKILRNKLRA